MNGNYEWQKFAAKQKTENYRRQAEIQRQLQSNKQNEPEGGSWFYKATLTLASGAILLIMSYLLNGCQTAYESIKTRKAISL